MPVPDAPYSDDSSSDENAGGEQHVGGAGKRLLLHGLRKNDIRDAAVDGELRYTAFGVPYRVGNHRVGSITTIQTSEANEAVEIYHSNPMLGGDGNGGGGGGVTAFNARADGHGERSRRQKSRDMMKHAHTDYLHQIEQQQNGERELSPLTSLNPSKPRLKVKRGRMRNCATATGSIADQIVNARIKKNNATPRALYTDPVSGGIVSVSKMTGSSRWATDTSTRRMASGDGGQVSTMDAVAKVEAEEVKEGVGKASEADTVYVDIASGRRYTVNDTTGLSEWLGEHDGTDDEDGAGKGQSELPEQQSSSHTEYVDPASRHKYRVNKTTGSSRWLQQEEVEEHVDPASGRRYTVDGITGLSQWLEDEDGDGDGDDDCGDDGGGDGDGESGGDGDGDGEGGGIETRADVGQVVPEEDGGTVVALYDYTSGEDGHIGLRAGETVVIVVRDTNGDGWTRVRGAESEGEEGGKGLLCPTSYLDWRREAQLAS